MLEIGMELILYVNSEKLKTKVADIIHNKIYVQYPSNIKTSRTEYLPNETRLEASFVKDNETYSFKTDVVGRTRRKIPFLILLKPSLEQIHRVQRREFVRVDTLLDIAFHFGKSRFTTITNNISAGGCAIVLPNQVNLKIGDQGKGYMVVPLRSGDIHYLMLHCEVRRIYEDDHIRYASLKFINMNNTTQQKIIRYCFEKQLENRQ